MLVGRKIIYFLVVLFFVPTTASAEQDFYGIRMKNELWAANLVLNLGPRADDQDLFQGNVLDNSVFADALFKEMPGDRMDLRINVVNQSTEAIRTDYEYRDYFIYLKNGQKIPLIDPEAQWRLASIEPKQSVTFNPSMGNLRVRHEDIRMIECSFDLGRTRLFLFPASKKDIVNKLRNPAPPELPANLTIKEQKEIRLKSGEKKAVEEPRQGLMQWLGLQEPATRSELYQPPTPAPVTAAPVAPVVPVVIAPPAVPEPPAPVVKEKKREELRSTAVREPKQKVPEGKRNSVSPLRGLLEWLGFSEPARRPASSTAPALAAKPKTSSPIVPKSRSSEPAVKHLAEQAPAPAAPPKQAPAVQKRGFVPPVRALMEWLGFSQPPPPKPVVAVPKQTPTPPAPKPAAPEKKTVPEKKRSSSPSPLYGVMEWLGFVEPAKTTASKSTVPSSSKANSEKAPVTTQEKLDAAINNFRYVPATGTENRKAGAKPEASAKSTAVREVLSGLELPRQEAHVLEYNKIYNFITVNMGAKDGLKKKMIICILRNGKVVARAQIQQLRDAVAAAGVIAYSKNIDIRPGDLISVV